MKITTEQLKQIIREEIRKKPLKEAKEKVPAGVKVTHLGGKRYTIEYQKYGWEPTMQDLSNTDAMLRKAFTQIADKIEAGSLEKGTAYVRHENVCYGIGFNSKLKADKVDDILFDSFGMYIDSRD